MTATRIALAVLATAFALPPRSFADPEPLQVPAKSLPVPTADISPEMQQFIGRPLVNGSLKLTRFCQNRQLETDPPRVICAGTPVRTGATEIASP